MASPFVDNMGQLERDGGPYAHPRADNKGWFPSGSFSKLESIFINRLYFFSFSKAQPMYEN